MQLRPIYSEIGLYSEFSRQCNCESERLTVQPDSTGGIYDFRLRDRSQIRV
jgi:hypothetical protein